MCIKHQNKRWRNFQAEYKLSQSCLSWACFIGYSPKAASMSMSHKLKVSWFYKKHNQSNKGNIFIEDDSDRKQIFRDTLNRTFQKHRWFSTNQPACKFECGWGASCDAGDAGQLTGRCEEPRGWCQHRQQRAAHPPSDWGSWHRHSCEAFSSWQRGRHCRHGDRQSRRER